MRQPPLFPEEEEPNPKHLARSRHPEESKAAARYIAPKLGHLHAEVYALVERFPDLTASELAAKWTCRDIRKVGRRLPELAEKGRIFKSGSRPCSITKRPAATWKVTKP